MNARHFRIAALIIAGTLVVGLVAATVFFQRDIQHARDRIATGSQVAQTPCGPIEYAVTGDGPPLLVVHGAGGGFDQGLDIAGPLAERGFRLIAMSRFGYLRTPLPTDASPEAQADAHACLLDVLGLKRVAVFGVSAGAPSSLQFSLRHPKRISALVLLVPATYVPRAGGEASVSVPNGLKFVMDMAMRSDFLFWTGTRFTRAGMIRTILGTPLSVVENASPPEQARLGMLLDHVLPISQRRLGLLNEAAILPSIQRYALERIKVPTLTISFADDLYGTYESARYTAGQIGGARFVGYPHGGHMGVGHQQDVWNEVSGFLKPQ